MAQAEIPQISIHFLPYLVWVMELVRTSQIVLSFLLLFCVLQTDFLCAQFVADEQVERVYAKLKASRFFRNTIVIKVGFVLVSLFFLQLRFPSCTFVNHVLVCADI